MESVEARAVKIAAKIMQAAGLCRYDSACKCRKVYVDEATCDKCIERWLLAKARKELKKEQHHDNERSRRGRSEAPPGDI